MPCWPDRIRGAHALLRDGATLVETADDILEALGWHQSRLAQADGTTSDHELVRYADDPVAQLSPGYAYGPEQLAAIWGLQPAVLLARLLELELSGRVRRVAGGRFIRSRRTC